MEEVGGILPPPFWKNIFSIVHQGCCITMQQCWRRMLCARTQRVRSWHLQNMREFLFVVELASRKTRKKMLKQVKIIARCILENITTRLGACGGLGTTACKARWTCQISCLHQHNKYVWNINKQMEAHFSCNNERKPFHKYKMDPLEKTNGVHYSFL